MTGAWSGQPINSRPQVALVRFVRRKNKINIRLSTVRSIYDRSLIRSAAWGAVGLIRKESVLSLVEAYIK
jgi:hypothetical protein